MINLRSSDYCRRYEFVSYDLQTPITLPGNNQSQKKDGYRFIVDSSSDDSVLDWFNSYIEMTFKVSKAADNTNFVAADNVATVNGAHSFIQQLRVKFNSLNVLDSPNINHCVNVKNLVDYSQEYSKTVGSSMFYYPDTSTGHADDNQFTTNTVNKDGNQSSVAAVTGVNANYNEGFAKRHTLIIGGAENNVIIPLNCYGFFESFENQVAPNGKVEIEVVLVDDNNVLYRNGGDQGRFVVTELTLWVPKMVLNADGSKIFLERFMTPHEWTYLKERLEISPVTQTTNGSFRISPNINRPRHVFVWFLNSDVMGDQTKNPFIFNTYNIRDGKTVSNCRLELSNGIYYPEKATEPTNELSKTFRSFIRYNKQMNYHLAGSLITQNTFKDIYGLLYFDITNQSERMKNDSTKLEFRYQLNEAPNAQYNIYAMVLSEEKISVDLVKDKAFLRA